MFCIDLNGTKLCSYVHFDVRVYSWGYGDVVKFATREAAQSWINEHRVFCGDAQIIAL